MSKTHQKIVNEAAEKIADMFWDSGFKKYLKNYAAWIAKHKRKISPIISSAIEEHDRVKREGTIWKIDDFKGWYAQSFNERMAREICESHNATLEKLPTGHQPHQETDHALQDFLHKLGQDFYEIENHCPCGARPESPNTHPHVGGCPVERAIRRLKTFAQGRGANVSPDVSSSPVVGVYAGGEQSIGQECAAYLNSACGGIWDITKAEEKRIAQVIDNVITSRSSSPRVEGKTQEGKS